MEPFDLGALDPQLKQDLHTDLLAVADTKLVLGNWHAKCVHNGRSLPDFAAIMGMASTSYGHARALYLYLVNFGTDYATLERGREAGDICSMNLLDEAPRSWEDYVASIYLAEQATWLLMSGFLKHRDRALGGLAEKIGQEVYFHLKYADGWMKIFARSGAEPFAEALAGRFPLALQWFGPADAPDPLHDAGLRTVPLAAIRESFIREIGKARDILGVEIDLSAADAAPGADWRPDGRRAGAVPDGLYEVIRFKDGEAAHP